MKLKSLFFFFLLLLFVTNLQAKAIKLNVTATAYNSLSAQTDSTPNIGAWGDRLKKSIKSIAVSRDLLKRGLKRNSVVSIKGLPGLYLVKDKMNKRWRNKIDIFMGKNKRKALKWGRQKIELTWYK